MRNIFGHVTDYIDASPNLNLYTFDSRGVLCQLMLPINPLEMRVFSIAKIEIFS
ncbi:hypothetical protein COO91_04781 [Nostoc flagelliforme CCNUN1]|uniref:Uncharacterized protein n=1 Tax=Nostoc flagelliforme CCNUN1 TaxID=2038116 RepID=A0A2K8STN3_9NOSO|nr:hypothetical protein COO91_04781 [Nostoc flagelliforme CCNUN1]